MKKTKKTTVKKTAKGQAAKRAATTNKRDKRVEKLKKELAYLQVELEDTRETLRAIQAGEVDALVVTRKEGQQVFTLEGAEHPYRVVIETMTEGTATLSNEGTVLYCNNRFSEILKTPMEIIVGGYLDSYLSDKNLTEFKRMLKASRTKTVRGELVLKTSNGEEVPALISLAVLKDTIKGICIVITDVRELKNAEKALREANETLEERVKQRTAELQESQEELQEINEELSTTNELLQTSNDELRRAEEFLKASEERFRTAFEQGGIPMFLTTLSYKLMKVNAAFCEILGYSESELADRDMYTLVHPDDMPMCRKGLRHVISGDINTFRMEKRYIHKDGHIVWTDMSTVSVRDDKGKPLYIITHVQDITERKRAEDALRQSEEQLRALADAIPNLAWWAKGDGYIIWYNRRWYEYTGTTPQEMEGWGWQSVHDPKTLPKVLERWKASIATGKPFNMVFPLRGADGRFRQFLTRVEPLKDAQGQVVRWFGTNTDVEELKKAEDAVRENQERLKRAQAIAHLGSWELDLVSDRLTWSDEVYRIFGLEPQKFASTYEAFLERVHPDDRAAVDEAYSGSLRKNLDMYEIEHRVIRKDNGEIRFVHEKCEHVRDKTGKIIRSQGMIHDITERKRADEALRQSEERYRGLFKNMINGFAHCQMLFDDNERPVNFTYLDVNSAFYQMTGLENVVGKSATEIFPNIREEHPELLEIYGRVARSGNPERFEIDFKPLAKLLSVSVYSSQQDYFTAILEDITERKRAEEQLRQNEERLRTLSEAVPSIVWTTEPDGTPDFYNKRWYEYTGLPADMAGAAWKHITHPDDWQATKEGWTRSVKTGAAYKIQHRIRRADGQYHWHLSQGIPLRDSEGNTLKWFCTTTDIEEQIRNQQDIERFRDELEHKNEELESIIRIASHDLRSPLTNIKGFSGELARDLSKAYELLATVALPEEVSEKIDTVFNKYVKEAIGFIQTSADSINHMLKNLMQVAKAGTMPINIQYLDMNSLIGKMAANVQFKLKQAGGQFEIENLPECRGDAEQVAQVFTNVVENAIKYRDPQRPIYIHIYAAAEKGMATYCVEDNGKGIAPEHLDKVFDLFTRLEPETAKGEGLGLTIAKRMIERQGGKIWASSELGKGSKFFVSLPY